MKKIFLILSAILALSCSNQDVNEVSYPNNGNVPARERGIKVTNEIDLMFSHYVNSESYINMKEHSNSFLAKLKINPSGLNFENEVQMFDWLEMSLYLTNFENLTEAKVKWQEFKKTVEVDLIKNKMIYDYIKTAPLNDVAFYIEKWEFSTVIYSDNECDKAFSGCVENATLNYITSSAANAMGGGSSFGYSLAQMAFTSDTNWCMQDFIACVDREN